MKINSNIAVEGFNPEEYAKNYDDMEGRFLPYEVQRWWFDEVYPDGRISTSRPEQDPEHNPGAYVSTASIWKNKADAEPDVVISARATPTDVDTIDPYQDCQRKAIAAGLKMLGFWLPIEKPSTPAVNPLTIGMKPDNLIEEKHEAIETEASTAPEEVSEPVTAETVEEKPAEPKKRRGRKKAEPIPAETVEVKIEEPVKAVDSKVEEPVTSEVEVVEPTEGVEETIESEMTLEEAQNLKVGYRRFADMLMKELLESDEGKRLFDWMLTSARAEEKLPEQVKAAKIMKAAEEK